MSIYPGLTLGVVNRRWSSAAAKNAANAAMHGLQGRLVNLKDVVRRFNEETAAGGCLFTQHVFAQLKA